MTAGYSQLATHSWLLTTHSWLLTTHSSLLTAGYSLLTAGYSQLATHMLIVKVLKIFSDLFALFQKELVVLAVISL